MKKSILLIIPMLIASYTSFTHSSAAAGHSVLTATQAADTKGKNEKEVNNPKREYTRFLLQDTLLDKGLDLFITIYTKLMPHKTLDVYVYRDNTSYFPEKINSRGGKGTFYKSRKYFHPGPQDVFIRLDKSDYAFDATQLKKKLEEQRSEVGHPKLLAQYDRLLSVGNSAFFPALAKNDGVHIKFEELRRLQEEIDQLSAEIEVAADMDKAEKQRKEQADAAAHQEALNAAAGIQRPPKVSPCQNCSIQ